ncbi:MAG TPA: DUF4124 domain-containing protein [Nevskiaceae bacterium]
MKRLATLQCIAAAWSIAAVLAFAPLASGQVYRWTDAQGVVHYSDTPHDKNQQPVDLPSLQTMESGAGNVAPLGGVSRPAAPVGTPVQPRVVAPADGTTLRDAQSQVQVSVSGALSPGDGYVYYLDGKPQNAQPTTASSMLLTDVWRGEHQIEVAVVGGDGQVLASSPPVTIYMHQPSVNHPGRQAPKKGS